MSNDRRVAGKVLETARITVTKQRGAQHGDVETSFTMIAELWSVWINHATYVRTGMQPVPLVHLSASDVLHMMSMLKKARAVYGDAAMEDHYVDDVGYSALAGMLHLPDGGAPPDPVNIVQDALSSADPDQKLADKLASTETIPQFLKDKVK